MPDLMPNAVKRYWTSCPICGESDMRCEEDAEGHKLILCSNHGCASNAGDSASAYNTRHAHAPVDPHREMTRAEAEIENQFSEGVQAFKDGLGRNRNPHPDPAGRAAVRWDDGWTWMRDS